MSVCDFKTFKLISWRDRLFTAAILAIASVLCGLAPEITPSSVKISSVVYAQEYTEQEVIDYANTGYKVELLRQRVYQEIKKMVNAQPPDIICNQRQTFRGLPENISQIANNYCLESMGIVEENLTPQRFNQLKKIYDLRGEFYQKVQQELIDLQKNNPENK